MPFWPLCCESKAFLSKKFRPGLQAGLRDLGRKNRDLGNRASPASHMNTLIFLQRKEWQGEILETEKAQFTRLV